MTPFGTSVARELRTALVPIETASIVGYRFLAGTSRALVKNALFYVVATPAIDVARDQALRKADTLAQVIHDVGVRRQGISLSVDQARSKALVAFEALIDVVAAATLPSASVCRRAISEDP